jgi:hypothetical protein
MASTRLLRNITMSVAYVSSALISEWTRINIQNVNPVTRTGQSVSTTAHAPSGAQFAGVNEPNAQCQPSQYNFSPCDRAWSSNLNIPLSFIPQTDKTETQRNVDTTYSVYTSKHDNPGFRKVILR